MAFESFPNDAHNDRAVTLAEHEQIVVPLGLSGLLGYSGTAPVFGDSTGRQVKLRSGVSASVRGTRFNNTSEAIIAIAANSSGNPRIDLVVLRLRRQDSAVDAGDRYTVAPAVIQGTPAATPAAPSPVRDNTPGAGFWDIPLAEVTVINAASTITAEQVAPRAFYITGSGYTGRDDWGRPPVEAGVMFRAVDTGITYVGTAAGTWLPLGDDVVDYAYSFSASAAATAGGAAVTVLTTPSIVFRAGHAYLVELVGGFGTTTTGNLALQQVYGNSKVICEGLRIRCENNHAMDSTTFRYIANTGSSDITTALELRIQCVLGSGTVTHYANATNARALIVRYAGLASRRPYASPI